MSQYSERHAKQVVPDAHWVATARNPCRLLLCEASDDLDPHAKPHTSH